MECPHCTADLPDDDIFCEECGKPLGPGCVCGASVEDVDEDGYCANCGRRVRPRETDHMEQEISPDFAAVSDRGKRHDRNEDRFAIRQLGDRSILVVCDGVSSSREPELASSLGVETITAALETHGDVLAAMAEAAGQIARLAPKGTGEAPSTTAVAALVSGDSVTVAWAGDSRAYWIDATGVRQLTSDHSWSNEVVSSGAMSADEAEKSPRAHSITRWFGADAGKNATPDVIPFAIPGEGTLLLCTDGLWNYDPDLSVVDHGTALEASCALVEFANSKGGADNITAALLRLRKAI